MIDSTHYGDTNNGTLTYLSDATPDLPAWLGEEEQERSVIKK